MFGSLFLNSFCIHSVCNLLDTSSSPSVGCGSQLTMPLFALVGGEAHSLFLESTIGSLFSLRSSFFTLSPICLYQVSLIIEIGPVKSLLKVQ